MSPGEAMSSDSIEVWLYGEHLGDVRRSSAGTRFVATADALDRHGLGSNVLSIALPLDSTPAPVANTEAFFGGLLPEGARLTALLSQEPNLSRDNLIGLLEAVGRDVAGALLIPGPDVTTLGPLLSEEEVAHEVANPSGYLAGGGSALAGMRPKVGLAQSRRGWHAARDGHPSTHIIKPAGPDNIRSIHAEVWVMRLARAAGLIDFDVWFEAFGSVPAVVVERFDRRLDGNRVHRIHQEDAAQALGLAWGSDAKFEWANPRASLRSIAGLLDRDRSLFATGPSDRESLLAHTVFRLIVGDTDAHAKNHALLHSPDGAVRLAPLYDVTPAMLYGDGGGLALSVAGQRTVATVTADAVVEEAQSWGLEADTARDVAMATAEVVRDCARNADADGSIADHLPGYVTQAAQALLEGRPVGLNLGEFPTVEPLAVV